MGGGDISRMTEANSATNFLDDSKIIEYLNNDNNFEELDMGQIDEEDKPFILIDKDTGKVYDIRNESVIQKFTSSQVTRITTDLSPDTNQKSKAWTEWWKEKRTNDQDFISAAETGNLTEIKRLLDKCTLKDLSADINVKGLD